MLRATVSIRSSVKSIIDSGQLAATIVSPVQSVRSETREFALSRQLANISSAQFFFPPLPAEHSETARSAAVSDRPLAP